MREASLEQDNKLLYFYTAGFSMWPFIRQGQRLVIKKTSVEDLAAGDVILYRLNSQLVCHRLIKKVNGKIFVRGDNSVLGHEVLTKEAILGKAIASIENGKIISLEKKGQKTINHLIIIFGPFFGVFARFIKSLFWKKVKE